MAKEEQILSTLKTATGLNVYALEKPGGDNNCITYRVISSKKYRTLSQKLDLSRERFLFNCYGSSYSEAKSLSDLVYSTLELNTTDFHGCTCENIADEPKQIDVNLYVRELEFFVW